MKYKIITDGKQYRICRKFLWWWSITGLPHYDSVKECKAAIFRVWGDSPQELVVENLNITQQAKGEMRMNPASMCLGCTCEKRQSSPLTSPVCRTVVSKF